MAVYSSWLAGSLRLSSAATVTVNATDVDIAAGDYYVRDATSSISLIAALQTAIASVAAGSTVYIGMDRKVRIDFNGASTSLSVPASIRGALGLTSGTYGAATSLTAEAVSTLLWSPGWPETTKGSPVGVDGRPVYDSVCTSSPSGLTYDATIYTSTTRLDLSWSAVRPDRGWSTGAAGEFSQFFTTVIVQRKRWKLYSQVLEDDASASAVTWPTAKGPYFVPEPNFDWYDRFVADTDALGCNIAIEGVKTSDYT